MPSTASRTVNAGLMLVVALLLLLFAGRIRAADPVELEAPLFINIGGGEFIDDVDNVWLPDREYGSTVGYGYVDFPSVDSEAVGGPGIAVSGTVYDPLFGQAREGLDAYRVNLPNGTYEVKLHFAEVSGQITGSGQRVQDVYVQGIKVLDAYDVHDAVGPQAAASKLFQDVVVTDGQLSVQFVTQLGASIISGLSIELIVVLDPTPTPRPTATPTPVPPAEPVLFVNAGGPEHVDAAGNVWRADGPFSAAGYGYIDDGNSSIIDRRSFGNLWLDIASTTEDGLFATARNGVDRYDFIVPPGIYSIDLLFTETELQNLVGHRVFDVSIQGVTVLDDFDIIAESGSYQSAVTRRIEGISATGGRITIRFLTAAGSTDTESLLFIHRPEISAIGVWTYVAAPPPATPTPTPTPVPSTPTPALPTATPPSFGGGSASTPTPIPPDAELATPTPAPTPMGTLVTDDPTFSEEGHVIVGLLRNDSVVDGVRAYSVAVTIDADMPVSGFSFVANLPVEGFEIRKVAVSGWLLEAGFDGLPRVDRERGSLLLSGGFATPIEFSGASVVSVELFARPGGRTTVREASVSYALVRDASDREMAVEIGAGAVWGLLTVELADVNGDGLVGPADVLLVVGAYGSEEGGRWFDERADLNGDGVVDLRDLAILGAGHE